MRALLPLASLLALGGCASPPVSTGAPARPPVDVPPRFVVGEANTSAVPDPAPGKGCRNPMVDPRTNARLVLVRSSDGQGDYTVPDGAYGVRAGEILRIDCATGVAQGIYPRPR